MRPDDVGTLLAAARFFGEAGQHSRARAIYERILSLEPNNGPAREALAGSLTGSPTP
jgi:Tfp pilus assembly protein PilF